MIKCTNCKLETRLGFPSVICTHCWEVINLKKSPEYKLAKNILRNYGLSKEEAKESLENILTSYNSDVTIDASVLVKLAFANIVRTEYEQTKTKTI